MSYRNDVAEAKQLVKRSEEDLWRLAELTWRNIRPQGEATQRQWAADVGWKSHQDVGRYAQIWARFGGAHHQERPTFADAYAKLRTGDDDATSAGHRADRSLNAASPAAVAKAVAANPDFQRAIARNTDALEGIEEHGIEVRGTAQLIDRDLPKKVRHNAAEALQIDEAVAYLRGAVSELVNAVAAAEEYGVNDTEAEAEALKAIKRWLRIYEGQANWNDADADYAASLGVRL